MPVNVRWWMSEDEEVEFRRTNGSHLFTVNNDGEVGWINGSNTTWYSINPLSEDHGGDRVLGAESNGSSLQVILPRVVMRSFNHDDVAFYLKEFVDMLAGFAQHYRVCANGSAYIVMINTPDPSQQIFSIAYTADELVPEFDGGELDKSLYHLASDIVKEKVYEGPRPTRFERKPVI